MPKEKQACHVLFCSTALSFGGEQKLMVQILRHLDQEHFQPFICCIRPFNYVDPAILNSGVKIICLKVRGRFNLLESIRGLRQVINEHDIDLIHMGIFGSEFSGLLAALITRIPAIAILTTTYDLEARFATSHKKRLAQSWKWRAIYLVHAILARMVKVRYVALSEEIKKSAIRNLRLPAESVAVIHLGLNPEEFDGKRLPQETVIRLKNDLGLDGAYPILVNVARLSPVKGQRELLKAMPRVLEHFPRAKLLIAGDGPLLNELTELRDNLGLQSHVHLLGRRDDIATLLTVSDIFVFSSYYEGLPGAVIEAMAAGKPVVAFDIPSLREVVKDKITGFLIDGRDVQGFGEAVIRLADNREEALNMGVKAQRVVQHQFNIIQNLKKLEDLYEGMLTPTR